MNSKDVPSRRYDPMASLWLCTKCNTKVWQTQKERLAEGCPFCGEGKPVPPEGMCDYCEKIHRYPNVSCPPKVVDTPMEQVRRILLSALNGTDDKYLIKENRFIRWGLVEREILAVVERLYIELNKNQDRLQQTEEEAGKLKDTLSNGEERENTLRKACEACAKIEPLPGFDFGPSTWHAIVSARLAVEETKKKE